MTRTTANGPIESSKRPNVLLDRVFETAKCFFLLDRRPTMVGPCWPDTTENRYATFPNTNKAMVEIVCGISPEMRTSWNDMHLPFLTDECLPNILRQSAYRSIALTPDEAALRAKLLGFDSVTTPLPTKTEKHWTQVIIKYLLFFTAKHWTVYKTARLSRSKTQAQGRCGCFAARCGARGY